MVGIRGVFKNSSGSIIYLYYCNIGHGSNNVAGLTTLSSRLQSMVRCSLFPLEVEGNFHLIISLARNIQCRVSVNKLSLSWRISICLSKLESYAHHLGSVTLDHFANEGVHTPSNLQDLDPSELSTCILKNEFFNLAKLDC